MRISDWSSDVCSSDLILDTDRKAGVLRDAEHAFSKDGGLAVLYGNLAEDGCIVKTAGVDDSILKFSGPAHIFESQDDAVAGIRSEEHTSELQSLMRNSYAGF